MTLALLRDFRARWLTSPLPMVIEHRVGRPETICAAPSLWMGGKLVAERLRERGIREGSRVRYDGPSGALFVQALVGVLRTGAAFVAEALDGAEPHAVVHEDLSVTRTSLAPAGPEASRSGAPPSNEDESVRMIFRAADGEGLVRLREEDVDALAAAAAELLRRPSVDDALRIGCLGDWRDWRVAVVELLGGLALGSELHLGCEAIPSPQLEAIQSLPDVIVGRSSASASAVAARTLAIGAAHATLDLAFDVLIAPAGTRHLVRSGPSGAASSRSSSPNECRGTP